MKRLNKRSASSLSYQSLEPRQLLVADFISGTLTIQGSAGNDALAVVQVNDSIEIRSNDVVIEQFNTNQLERITFLGGDGDDSFQLIGYTATTLENVDFEGDAGNDRFEFIDVATQDIFFSFEGGLGDDVLTHTNSQVTGGLRAFGETGDDFFDISFITDGFRTDVNGGAGDDIICLLYTSPSPRDGLLSRMPSSA